MGLKTKVKRFDGNSAMRPGSLVSETVAPESWSKVASTIFRTGALPDAVGCKGFETKARNVRPLVLVCLEELPQETIATPLARRTAIAIKVLFKPGTPKSMKDGDLDAKAGIITEPVAANFRFHRRLRG